MHRRIFYFVLSVLGSSAAAQDLPAELVHRSNGRELARSTLHLSGGELRGTTEGEDVHVEARQVLGADGRLKTYERTVRGRSPDRLVSRVRVELAADGTSYRLRQEDPLARRTVTVGGGRVRAVLDPSWPEALLPALLEIDGGRIRLLDVEWGRALAGHVRPRESARYLELPGGGPTLFLDEEGGFRSLVFPGEEELRLESASAPPRASTPPPPGVLEEEVSVGEDGLGGTVTRPEADGGSYPGVVLLPDAGRDRNGDAPGLRSGLLRDLAWDLAEAGCAVLRYDARDPVAMQAGWQRLRKDARAAAMQLLARPETEGEDVALIGHGQGGLLAAAVARDRPDLVRAVVALAPPARPLRETMAVKLRARLRGEGASEEAVQEALQRLMEDLDALRDLPPDTELAPGRRLLKDLLPLVPLELYLDVTPPLLLLFGEDDPTVPATHRAMLQSAVALRVGEDLEVRVLSAANHEFRETGFGDPPGAGDAADVARRRHAALAPFVRSFLK